MAISVFRSFVLLAPPPPSLSTPTTFSKKKTPLGQIRHGQDRRLRAFGPPAARPGRRRGGSDRHLPHARAGLPDLPRVRALLSLPARCVFHFRSLFGSFLFSEPNRRKKTHLFPGLSRPSSTGVRVANFFGGLPIKQHKDILRGPSPPHIVVGTPGRVKQLAKDGDLKLGSLRHFVIDECDKVRLLFFSYFFFLLILSRLLSRSFFRIEVLALHFCVTRQRRERKGAEESVSLPSFSLSSSFRSFSLTPFLPVLLSLSPLRTNP